MNRYLKAAVVRYKEMLYNSDSKSFLINPISEIDAEIVERLVAILQKVGLTQVSEVMKTLKGVKDEEVLEALDSLLSSKIEVESPESKRNPTFFVINKERIFYSNIFGYEPCERDASDSQNEYSEKVYGIKLNPTPESVKRVPLYANHVIELNSLEDRNKVLDKIDGFIREGGFDVIDLLDE